MSIVYLNGEYVPADEAKISVNDRGFLFGDGIYEVTPAYRGKLFRFPQHLERMRYGLAELRLEFDPSGLEEIHRRLIDENGHGDAETSYVYVQITRGVAPRGHAFPKEPVPVTVYAFANTFSRPDDERWGQGFRAITVPDRRWARVDIKTIALLPNCLAQQAGVDAGVDDVVLVKDGIAIEGSHSNIFGVFDGVLTTHPATNEILHGISRGFVLELAASLGIPVKERAMTIEEFRNADEIFFSGTTVEVKPTVELDGERIGDGTPGPVTRALRQAFVEATDRVAGK